jgi:hypothetical protein
MESTPSVENALVTTTIVPILATSNSDNDSTTGNVVIALVLVGLGLAWLFIVYYQSRRNYNSSPLYKFSSEYSTMKQY